MINKLLGELYWPNMEDEIELFFEEASAVRRLYCESGGEKERISSFIKQLISSKIFRTELTHFGRSRLKHGLKTRTSRESFISIYDISGLIDLEEVKREIRSAVEGLSRLTYVKNTYQEVSGHYVFGQKISEALLKESAVPNSLCSETMTKIYQTSDIGEAFLFLEEFVTYKIKNSVPYKQMWVIREGVV